MSQPSTKPSYQRLILEQLRHPLKLRLVLCAAILAGWYVGFFAPLSERLAATTATTAAERKRTATAREIAQRQKALAPFQGRLLATSDLNTLIRHVMEHLRASPLKLIDLKPEKPKDLGPYEAVGLRLTLGGTFGDIDQFLSWVEANPLLLRIDAIKLDPTNQDPSRLTAQLVVLVLADKPAEAAKADTVKAKPAPAKR
jgi:Tfp pilus assembly protein PilO